MENLKRVVLYLSGTCDDVLEAFSRLTSIEALILRTNGMLSLESESSLSRIFNRMVGRSFETCGMTLMVENEQVLTALYNCFGGPLEYSIRKRCELSLNILEA